MPPPSVFSLSTYLLLYDRQYVQLFLPLVVEYSQGRINHSGAQSQRKAGGPFLICIARIFSGRRALYSLGEHFSPPPKKLTTFLVVVVTFKPTHTLNVQTSKQRGKNLAVDAGSPGGGAPFHGTTGTMVNPALSIHKSLDRPVSVGQAAHTINEIDSHC